MARCILSIDLGTTTLKAALLDYNQNTILEEHSVVLDVSIPVNENGKDEQDIIKMFSSLDTLMDEFPLESKRAVIGISVSGQMHGITLWDRSLTLDNALTSPPPASLNGKVSSLITWRDGRCSEHFLSKLPKTSKPVCTGFGCSSLFWLQQFDSLLIDKFERSGTIMDLLVWLLCGLDEVVMATHNANSWGYYDVVKNQWEMEILKSCGFPTRLLPKVVVVPTLAGKLSQSRWGIPSGIPVAVAMGDLQCSVYSVQAAINEAVFNIGTASQLSVVKPPNTSVDLTQFPAITEVPYFNDNTLLVVASLTGGNALSTFVNICKELIKSLDSTADISNDRIYSVLIDSAANRLDTSLTIDPLLLGERHDPSRRGSACGIAEGNATLGDIVSATLRGVVANMENMMPKHLLTQLQIERLVGCGSALHRNSVLSQHIERVFGLPLVIKLNADAPLGSALANRTLFDNN